MDASLALGQSYDCPSASDTTMKDMDEKQQQQQTTTTTKHIPNHKVETDSSTIKLFIHVIVPVCLWIWIKIKQTTVKHNNVNCVHNFLDILWFELFWWSYVIGDPLLHIQTGLPQGSGHWGNLRIVRGHNTYRLSSDRPVAPFTNMD